MLGCFLELELGVVVLDVLGRVSRVCWDLPCVSDTHLTLHTYMSFTPYEIVLL